MPGPHPPHLASFPSLFLPYAILPVPTTIFTPSLQPVPAAHPTTESFPIE